jgi:DNA-binding MarR family transcriptional regulator
MEPSQTGSATEEEPFRAVGFMVSSLGYAVANKFTAIMSPFGLEARQFAALRRIGFAEGGTQQSIGEQLKVSASRMVKLIDELEERGLLERRPSPSDRRAHALYLTDTGSLLLERAAAAAAAFDAELTSALTETERVQLLGLLDRLATALGVPAGVHGSQV